MIVAVASVRAVCAVVVDIVVQIISVVVGAVVVHVVPAPAGGSQSQQQNTEKQERDPSAFHDFTPPDSGIASSVSADCGNIPGTSGILFLKTVG